MSGILRAESSSHWYRRDGKPCHKVPNKSKPGQFRNTNLADARKLGLLASVTNILDEANKPQLTLYQIIEAIKAALALTDKDKEGLSGDEVVALAYTRSKDEVGVARKFGKAMHSAIEEFLCDGIEPDNPDIKPHFGYFREWWQDEVTDVYLAEATVVAVDYAGRLDAKVKTRSYGTVLMDFKTRKRKPATKKQQEAGELGGFTTYNEDGMQLAAYDKAEQTIETDIFDQERTSRVDNLLSVFIDSQNPSPVWVHVWSDADKLKYWNAFRYLKSYWITVKDYDPKDITQQEQI